MGESILVAIISGGVTLIGTILTVIVSSNKTDENLKINQAVTDAKIEELTREVREHNNFARRVPVIEAQIETIHHRLSNLEEK